MRRALCVLLTLIALCSGVALYIFLAPSLSSASPGRGNDLDLAFRPHPGARLPLAAVLTDESGRAVPLHNFFNKTPVVLVLEYLRCTSLCGVTLRNLVETLDRLPLVPGRDYQVVAVSIDPRDKPADAAAARDKYAALLGRAGGAAGLHFLTGPQAAVRQIADTVGFRYRYDKLLDAYIHPAGFVVVSPDGAISRYIEGIAASGSELIAAFADAQQDKSVGPLTRILLFCHIQGAPLGKYTVPVLAAFMLADVAAGLAALAIFFAIRRRSDRAHV
jgi:protein SCO1/2